MSITEQRILESSKLINPQIGFLFWRAGRDDIIEGFDIYLNAPLLTFIAASFQVSIDGVPLFDVNDLLVVESGESSATKTGLSIEITKGQIIRLDYYGNVGQDLGSFLTFMVQFQGPRLLLPGGTSASSFAVGTGSKAFTTQTDLGYTVGSRVRVSSNASPTTNYMEGVVTAYSGTTLTILVDLASGSGTHIDWLFNLTGERGATGVGDPGDPGVDGVDGNTILYGTVAPTSEGVNGDFYIRTTTSFIYGPKAAGTWPSGVSIIGATGPPARVAVGGALSDESTSLTTGTAKLTFRLPYNFDLDDVITNINTVSSSGLVTVDVNVSGSTILSTKCSIDQGEKTSVTAATPRVMSRTALDNDEEVTVDIDAAGTGAKGLKVWLIGKERI